MWDIYAQYKPCTSIHEFYIHVFSLYLAAFMYFAFYIYHFAMFSRYYPISIIAVKRIITSNKKGKLKASKSILPESAVGGSLLLKDMYSTA